MKHLIKCLPLDEYRAHRRTIKRRSKERQRQRTAEAKRRDLAAKHERMAKQFVMEHA